MLPSDLETIRRLLDEFRQILKRADEQCGALIQHIDGLQEQREPAHDIKKKLTGKQHKQLVNALLSAFSNYGRLTMMVRYQLEENLAAIAGSEEQAREYVVFKLVEWAVGEGRIEDLIQGAVNENPRNPELREFKESFLDK